MGTRVGLLASVLLAAGVAQAAQPAGDVNAQAADGTTPLLQAAYDGDAARVAALLKAGADPRIANQFGASPMGEAARRGDAAVLGLLLKAGADPESPNPEGQTALMAVARTGNVEAARLLLSHGAKINAREKWGGQTALIWAAAQGQAGMVRFLLSKGADSGIRATVRDWQRKITAEGRPKDMNRGGLTALLYAAREGNIDCVRELAKGRADLNLADPDGTTPLVLALMNGHWDTAKLLIESGADVEQWDFYGQSPLYVAIDIKTVESGGRVELPTYDMTSAHDVVQLLLEKGANPNLQLKLRPPFRNVPQDRLADPMLTTGATPLLRAAKAGDADSIRLLLAHGARVDLRNVLGHSPLMAAAGSGRGNVPTRGRSKTEAQALESIRLLKDAGADVNARGVDGDNAVHGAAIHGWNEVIKLLAGYGANLDVADKDGMTPIDYALARYPLNYLESKPVPHESTAALLKSLGATKETPNPPAWPPMGVPQSSAQVPQLPY
jgi:ankyrin repeat protein